jgi:hypothetical protein
MGGLLNDVKNGRRAIISADGNLEWDDIWEGDSVVVSASRAGFARGLDRFVQIAVDATLVIYGAYRLDICILPTILVSHVAIHIVQSNRTRGNVAIMRYGERRSAGASEFDISTEAKRWTPETSIDVVADVVD